MKLTHVIQICKNMFPKKMDFDSINVLDTGWHKTFPIHSTYGGKILRGGNSGMGRFGAADSAPPFRRGRFGAKSDSARPIRREARFGAKPFRSCLLCQNDDL